MAQKPLLMFSFALSFLIVSNPASATKAECLVATKKIALVEHEIKTTDPFGLLPENQFKVAIVESVPDRVVRNSKIIWLQDVKSLNLVKSMLQRGVPLVRGQIPEGTTADAFVLPPRYQMTLDVLKFKKDNVHKNILFLQDHATTDVIAHELQHWTDYEDGTIDAFIAQLKSLKKTAKLSEKEFGIIQDAVVELRGHARQELTLMANPQTNDSASLGLVESNYRHYAEALVPILNRLRKSSPTAYQDLLNLLKKFEIDEKTNIRFTVILSGFYNP
jgi:hypothetical protein